MAKFCFYCGKEIAEGKRCVCRDSSTSKSTASAASSSRQNQQTKSDPFSKENSQSQKSSSARGKKFSSFFRRKKAHSATAKAQSSYKGGSYANSTTAFRDSIIRTWAELIAKITLFFTPKTTQLHAQPVSIKSFIGSSLQYILNPTDKIRRESNKSIRPFSWLFLMIFSIFSGFTAWLFMQSGSEIANQVFSTTFKRNSIYLLKHPFLGPTFLIIFFGFMLFIFCFSFWLGLRLSNRRISFRKTMDLLSISLAYVFPAELLLIITMILGSKGFVGFFIISIFFMLIAQFITFRNSLHFSENSLFYFFFTCYLLFYIIMQLATSLIAWNLTTLF